MTLGTPLLQVTVTTTPKNLDYWATKDWLSSDAASTVRKADILIVPWENFRAEKPALFPNGTADFFNKLQKESQLAIVIVANESNYEEVALHGNVWRIPTLLLTLVVLPTFTQILGTEIQKRFDKPGIEDRVEMKVLINGANGKCIEIEYKGPPESAVDSVLENATKYCGEQSSTDE